jgi:Leucine-rich repeat (LRR) protein
MQKNCTSSNLLKLNFLKSVPLLENLQLCANNFEYLNGGVENFKYSTKLKVLNMSNNQIKTLSRMLCSMVSDSDRSNSYLRNLQQLYLTHNNLARIEQSDMSCLYNLQELDLEHNKIEYISLNSFRNLNRLKLLKIAYNPNLVPQPTAFVGLQGSLSHLSINFNLDAATYTQLKFDLILENLIDNYKLTNLEYLDLDGSNFESIRLNLAYLFFKKNNRLKIIRCANCVVKSFGLAYEIRKGSGSEAGTSDAGSFESFNEYFKTSICQREALNNNADNNKFISVDFRERSVKNKKVSIGLCKADNGENHAAPSLTCNKSNYFINKLLKYLQINNLFCMERLPDGKSKHIEVIKYNLEKYSALGKHFESTSCNERIPSGVDCARYFQIRKTVVDEKLPTKSDLNKYLKATNSSIRFNSNFSIVLTFFISVVFLF